MPRNLYGLYRRQFKVAPILSALLAACSSIGIAGCDSVPTRNTGAAALTLVGAHLPTAQIQQVYYLGMFDPRDQLTPTIYRIRIRGQASALNTTTKFATGWVHASVIDSLSTSGKFSESMNELGNKLQPSNGEKGLLTGRRLIMFGPEGFREAPKDHRLVVVMGSDPEGFFGAVDSALGAVAEVTQGTTVGPEVARTLLAEMARLRAEGKRYADVVSGLDTDDAGTGK